LWKCILDPIDGTAPGVRGDAAVFDDSSGIRLPKGLLAGNEYSVALWVKPMQLTELSTAFSAARNRDNWVSRVPRGSGAANNDTMVWSGSAAWYDATTRVKIRQAHGHTWLLRYKMEPS
jgi:arabinan endo-1,5-alpha-L-arabinosidase